MKSKYAYTIQVPADKVGWGESQRVRPALKARIEVEIDIEQIAQHHGKQAARSKGKSRRLLGGMVKIRVLSTKEEA